MKDIMAKLIISSMVTSLSNMMVLKPLQISPLYMLVMKITLFQKALHLVMLIRLHYVQI